MEQSKTCSVTIRSMKNSASISKAKQGEREMLTILLRVEKRFENLTVRYAPKRLIS